MRGVGTTELRCVACVLGCEVYFMGVPRYIFARSIFNLSGSNSAFLEACAFVAFSGIDTPSLAAALFILSYCF